MASKLEALKRYMGGGAPEEKLKKKRKKKKTDGGFGMFVVDDEDAWDDSVAKQAKKKDLWQDERTDYDEDQPTIVGDGADEYDPESQPVVANAEEFLERERAEELEKQWLALEKNPSTDASPPRKDRQKDASPPRKAHQLVDSSPSTHHAPGQFEDLSPPRKNRNHDKSPPRQHVRENQTQRETSSPQRRPQDDASPPRRLKRETSSPQRRPREDTSSPRRKVQENLSPPHSRGDDVSPSRRRHYSSPHRRDASPRRRSNRDDSSSPRRWRKQNSSSPRRSRFDRTPPLSWERSASPRQLSRYDSASPPRRSHRGTTSLPRRSRRSTDRSPPRKSQRDFSPPYNRSRRDESSSPRRYDNDGSTPPRRRSRFDKAPSSSRKESPPRRSHGTKSSTSPPPSRQAASPPRVKSTANTSRRDDDAAQASSPHRQTVPDQSALGGVFTGKEFKAQQDQLRASQQAAFHDEELMGKQAETVYRDKRGRKLDMLMEMQRQQEIQEGKRKREAKEEFEWGTGKVRKEELKSQQNELEAIRAKPFARHNDDAELEKLRKDKQRDFDPMQSSLFKDELDEKVKRVPKKNEKPKYSGPPAPPNRFNIPPGYRWDGVVRGNNWEEKALLKVNARKALKQDMYQWATADM
ncbi:hypothetical protein H310_00366 [Aphanomyces invadans]|uniref:BUD13 homolog n=1 Tax=Aphanomyces invadans TaxID=157072 RepID=A0A024UVK9_9STRA|nr:hypothetical protein H310_00366 [Aphanomyces invadans]ETW09942.1 hypothetical protein H310_00366 [Aphanomyces invadans]|eukprot:XP_008861353.1 hypothetical protein H310_00366 [Aphanomyces invadans]